MPDVLVTADQIDRGKPAPDAYLLAAERLGADPAECVVLEDAPAGVAAGRAAGMAVWAVATTHDPAELGAADRVAARLADLLPEHLAVAAARLDDRSDRQSSPWSSSHRRKLNREARDRHRSSGEGQ